MLNLVDESTREYLAIRVARRLSSHDIIDTLSDAMILHGIPEHVRSDNGPEFVAKDLRRWLADTGVSGICCGFLLLLLQDAPHRPGKNHALHVGRHLAGIQHSVVARLAIVEFAQFSAKHIGAKDELFKRIAAAGGSVRANHPGPPED